LFTALKLDDSVVEPNADCPALVFGLPLGDGGSCATRLADTLERIRNTVFSDHTPLLTG